MRSSRPLPTFISSALKKFQDFLSSVSHVSMNFVIQTYTMGLPCWIWRRWYLFAIMNNFTMPPVAISDPQYVVCDRCDNALFPLEKKHKLGRCTLWHSAFAQQIITIYPPACSVGPQRRHPFNSIQDRTLTGVQHPSQTSLLCHRSVVSQESCARESVEKQGCNSVASRWKISIKC